MTDARGEREKETTTGCGRLGSEISGYLDRELAPERALEVGRHLEECLSCRGVAEDLRRVKERAKALGDRMPERDLWPGIRSAVTGRAGTRAPTRRRRGVFLTLPQMAAAASVVLLAGMGFGWRALGPVDPVGPGVAEPRTPGAIGGDGAEAAHFAAVDPGPDHAAEVDRLQRILEDQAGALRPATARLLQKNLAVIERAIEDARAALAADPGNAWVEEHLRSTYDRKLIYLRDATELLEWQAGA